MKFKLLSFLQIFFILSSYIFLDINISLADTSSVVINEIAWMGTLASANSEWIELRNTTDSEIDISGWTLISADNSPNIILSGVIAAKGFFILERTSDATVPEITANQIYIGALSNTGEQLVLKNTAGDIIDDINTASWLTGNNDTKLTMSRAADLSWLDSLLPGGTPGAENFPSAEPDDEEDITEEDIPDEDADTDQDGEENIGDEDEEIVDPPVDEELDDTPDDNLPPDDENTSEENNQENNIPITGVGLITINEIVSDPESGEEWVELYNNSSSTISLTGWTISEAGGSITDLTGEIEKFFIIENPKGNLNNDGDQLILKNSSSTEIDKLSYGNFDDGNASDNAPVATKPNSLVRSEDGKNTSDNSSDFAITTTITKGEANIITAPIITPPPSSSNQTSNNNLNNNLDIITPPVIYDYSEDIIISEILPDPEGSDDEEFIEIFNKGARPVNLLGWKIGDASTARFSLEKLKIFSSSSAPIIHPQEYIAVYRSESKIALNNSGDEVKIFAPEQATPEYLLKYTSSEEGLSYASLNSAPNEFKWTTVITPGKENIILATDKEPIIDFGWSGKLTAGEKIIFDGSESYDPEGAPLSFEWTIDEKKFLLSRTEYIFKNAGDYNILLKISDGKNITEKEKIIKIKAAPVIKAKATSSSVATAKAKTTTAKTTTAKKTTTSKTSAVKNNFVTVSLPEAKTLAAGTLVKTRGTVAVEPGVFGTQYFYIVGSPGIQVYSYKKDFPEINVGDLVEVSGEVAESQGEKRIKITTADDIKLITPNQGLAARFVSCAEAKETQAELVSMEGEVTKKRGGNFYLDDGSGEVLVTIKTGTGISLADVSEGKKIKVSGLAFKSGEEVKLLPRSPEDIVLDEASAASSSSDLNNSNEKIIKIIVLAVLAVGGIGWGGYKVYRGLI